MKTVMGLVALCAVIGGISSSDAHAMAKPKKVAIVIGRWDDGWFGPEADAVASKYQTAGWTVRKLKNTTTTYASMHDAILANLTDVTDSSQQVVIDMQAHGSDPGKSFSGYDWTLGKNVTNEYLSPVDALRIGNNTFSMPYPYNDDAFLQNHGANPYLIDSKGNGVDGWISAAELLDIATQLNKRGVPTSVLDHSCNGGSTVRLFERNLPSVCAIGTAGIMTPGLTGYPATSTVIAKGVTQDQIANFISQTYYTNNHPQGSRTQSIGYKTGCTDTLPLRESFTIAAGAFGTWMPYGTSSPSLVYLEAHRFSKKDDSWMSLPYPQDGLEEQNPMVYQNPDYRASWGVIRWQTESLSGLQAKRAFISSILNAFHLHDPMTDVTAKTQAMWNAEWTYYWAIIRMNNRMRQTTFTGPAVPAGSGVAAASGTPIHMVPSLVREDDNYRRVLFSKCMCPADSTQKLGNWSCSNVPAAGLYGAGDSINCGDPSGWIQGKYFWAQGWGGLINRIIDETLITSASKGITQAVIQMSAALKAIEPCVSNACASQSI